MVSVTCIGVRFSVKFHFMFVHYTFSSVWVAEFLYTPMQMLYSLSSLVAAVYINR